MSLVERGDITELVQTGQFDEGIELEAKTASGAVPRNAWETISAFANTIGGALVLGLAETDEGWVVEGVSQPARMVRDLYSTMRDRAKISSDICGHDDIWIETIDDKALIVVRVRAAPRRSKPVYLNGDRYRAFIRRDQNDARCSEDEIERLRREAMPTTFDSQILPDFTIDDLDLDTVHRYRAMSEDARPQLGHHRLDDRGFLLASRAWSRDRTAGTEGPTVAGLLMFGTELAIAEIRPNHVIDYRRIPKHPTTKLRWTDRLRWTGNLYSAWYEIYPRLLRSLPVPFRLKGPQRQDEPAGQDALRESLVNLLVHTDYREMGDAVILDRDGGYVFLNPGDSWVSVEDLGVESRPERRNPCLATLFQNVGLAEQASSGFITIREEWHALGFRPPVVVSDPSRYRFELTLSLAGLIPAEDRSWLDSFEEIWTEPEELALLFARHDGAVDNATLRAASGQHLFDASQTLRSLRDRDLLILHGSGRNAIYVLGPAAIRSTDHLPESTDHLPESTDHLPEADQTQIALEIRRIAEPISSTGKASSQDVKLAIVGLCALTPMSTEELTRALDRRIGTVRRYVRNLVVVGELEPIHPQPQHPDQRYRAVLKSHAPELQTTIPI